MPLKKIITGQHVINEQQIAARAMRRQMTPAEAILWERLRARRLGGYHFRRQQTIDRFIVDFYCHQSSLVVEVDGGVHRGQAEYDRERDQFLNDRHLKILRFSNTKVTNDLEKVLALILAACQGRAGID